MSDYPLSGSTDHPATEGESTASVDTPVELVAEINQSSALASKLNWLRAGVLGANDGIVSVAGLVMGVAGATAEHTSLLIAGMAGLVAGALSMAGGEYVSVSSQRDTEVAAVNQVRDQLAANPDQALDDLAECYQTKGINTDLAHQVARELTSHDAIAAHAEARLGVSAHEPVNPWHAAWASLAAFTVGGIIPLLAMILTGSALRVGATIVAVIIALIITGTVSAYLGKANLVKAAWRNVVVGVLTMGLTYTVGHLVGIQL